MGFIKEANAERAKGLERIKDYQLQELRNKGELAKQELANKGSAAAASISASRPSELTRIFDIELAALAAKGKDPKDPVVRAEAMQNANNTYRGAGDKLAIQAQKGLDAAIKDINKDYNGKLLMAEGDPKETARLTKERDAAIQTKRDEYSRAIKTLEPGEVQTQTQNIEALPLPSKKEDLVTGKTYDTSKGPAKWDGKTFVKG